MRWNLESASAREARLSTWHEWFAWFPVRVGEQIVWLESVERKKMWGDVPVHGVYPSRSYSVDYRNLSPCHE